MYNIFFECPAKGCLAEKNHAIQALVFYRAHKSFCKCITVRRSRGASNRLHALSNQMPPEICRVFGIAVHDEVPTV
jgi:hypothetical protein